MVQEVLSKNDNRDVAIVSVPSIRTGADRVHNYKYCMHSFH